MRIEGSTMNHEFYASQRGLHLTAFFNRQEAVEECSVVPWFLNEKKKNNKC